MLTKGTFAHHSSVHDVETEHSWWRGTVLPELDGPGWTSDDFVRDMPVDFTLLLENVADPDHGIFAHQSATFDSFTASAAHPMAVSTAPGPGGNRVRLLMVTPAGKP